MPRKNPEGRGVLIWSGQKSLGTSAQASSLNRDSKWCCPPLVTRFATKSNVNKWPRWSTGHCDGLVAEPLMPLKIYRVGKLLLVKSVITQSPHVCEVWKLGELGAHSDNVIVAQNDEVHR
ncbi:hypothetical protein TNCV_608941 [Trichonephila clavipes]|nr:hypothetical protein TNCV_608941 [Trichonephila clavipes]